MVFSSSLLPGATPPPSFIFMQQDEAGGLTLLCTSIRPVLTRSDLHKQVQQAVAGGRRGGAERAGQVEWLLLTGGARNRAGRSPWQAQLQLRGRSFWLFPRTAKKEINKKNE